jgi:hypothetical protein
MICIAPLGGCTTMPLPDGSRIQRLPPDAVIAVPKLTPDEAQRPSQLNTRILAEQDAASARKAREEASQRSQQQWALDLNYGYPGGYWGGRHGSWHPGWSLGLGGYGPWPY